MVASDLDGTLLRSDGTVSDFTQNVLRTLEERGVPLVLLTARHLTEATDVMDHVSGRGLIVLSNGAVVWDAQKCRIHLERTIPDGVALEACRRIREAVPGSVFAVETAESIGIEPNFMDLDKVPAGVWFGSLEELTSRPIVKLMALHYERPPLDYLEVVTSRVGDLVTTTNSSSAALVDMSRLGVSKASTLAQLARDLGVDSRDVVAFGDMPNDIPMLDWAGHSYAMSNAHPLVIQTARHLTRSNNDDGVATMLATLFDLEVSPGGHGVA